MGSRKVADEVAANVSGAPLGAMEKGNAPFHAAKDQARAQRRAELAGVARGTAVAQLRPVRLLAPECRRHEPRRPRDRRDLCFDRICVTFQHSTSPLCNRNAKKLAGGIFLNLGQNPL